MGTGALFVPRRLMMMIDFSRASRLMGRAVMVWCVFMM